LVKSLSRFLGLSGEAAKSIGGRMSNKLKILIICGFIIAFLAGHEISFIPEPEKIHSADDVVRILIELKERYPEALFVTDKTGRVLKVYIDFPEEPK
jgi:hypothetical protein